MKKTLQLIAIVLGVLLACGIASAATMTDQGAEQDTSVAAGAATDGTWTFEGCFTYFPTWPCYDVFRDESGDLWICDICLQTGTPSEEVCTPLSGHGLWCS